MPFENVIRGGGDRFEMVRTAGVLDGTFLDEATSAALFGSIHAKHPLGNPNRMGLFRSNGSYHGSCSSTSFRSSMIRDVYSNLHPQLTAICVWGGRATTVLTECAASLWTFEGEVLDFAVYSTFCLEGQAGLLAVDFIS